MSAVADSGGTTLRSDLFRPRAILVAVAVLSAACTAARIQPQSAAGAPRVYATITIGDITMLNPVEDSLLPVFRRGLSKGFAEANMPTTELAAEGTSDSGVVVLAGRITELNRGSAMMRWSIGMGAGAARVSGMFFMLSASGDTLTAFQAEQTYKGGFGLGGLNFLSFEEVVDRLGKTVAAKAAQWARGQPIR